MIQLQSQQAQGQQQLEKKFLVLGDSHVQKYITDMYFIKSYLISELKTCLVAIVSTSNKQLEMFKLRLSLMFWLLPLVLGLGLRLYNWPSYPFSFDQVDILRQASKITSGDLILIGPKSGPINFFTGPLVTYLVAFFLHWTEPGIALVLSATVVSALTGSFFLLAEKRYWPDSTVPWLAWIWTLSPLLIQFDRGFWNPNLTLLASSLVFFPLVGHRIDSKSLTKIDLWLVAVGAFLGYQAHFSGLLLPLLVLIITPILGRAYWPTILAAAAGTATSLVPTLIFDLKHQWLNAKGILELALSTTGKSVNKLQIEIILTPLTTLGRVVLHQSQIWLAPVLALLVGCSSYLVSWHQKRSQPTTLALVWIGAVIMILALYPGSRPEYYYFIMLPACMFLLRSLLVFGFAQQQRLVICSVAAWGIYSTYLLISNITVGQLELGNQLRLTALVTQATQQFPTASIALDLPYHQVIGIDYLLSLRPINLSDQGGTIHLAPISSLTNQQQVVALSGDMALWYEQTTRD